MNIAELLRHKTATASGTATSTASMSMSTSTSTSTSASTSAAVERPGIVTIGPDETVADLVAALRRHNVGAAIVVGDGAARGEQGAQVAGIASERDVVRRLAEHGAELLQCPVSSIMTTAVTSCTSSDAVDAVAQTMTERRIRHMPVIDAGRLTGIVSIGDVVSSRISQLEHDRGQLEQYISS